MDLKYHTIRSRLAFLACWLIFSSFYCDADASSADTIQQGESLTGSQTIVSASGVFELGYFKPGNSTSYYLGIWYKKFSTKTVVWVANRDFPLKNSSAVLSLNDNGNLVIMEEKISYTITEHVSPKGNTSAILLDSGNFILRDQQLNILWESFDYPSDTWLPGMKLGYDKAKGKSWNLTAWRCWENPSPGDFTMFIDSDGSGQLLITSGTELYWTSGPWNGEGFTLIPELNSGELNFTLVSRDTTSYLTFSGMEDLARFTTDFSGKIKLWLHTEGGWNLRWSQPRRQCDIYNFCGAFGSCSEKQSPLCTCLPGFEPRFPEKWKIGDTTDGCVRKTDLLCYPNNGFLELRDLSLPDSRSSSKAMTAEGCRSACAKNCSCIAYAFDGFNCSLWNQELVNMRSGWGWSVHLKLPASELVKATASSDKKHSVHKKQIRLTVAVVVPLTIIVALTALACVWVKKFKNKGGKDLLSFDFSANHEAPTSTNPESKIQRRDGKKDVELPLFSFSSVCAATGNFSTENKVGEGGFGPVYKGTLSKGTEVAVKRLSRRSGQGWEELRNEATLIAKLQHKNLVKLLGCCIDKNEKILIYEYLPNKSLDCFLFDPISKWMLKWEMRIHIIEGIAQGLLYLHQYSRLQIIHRDLKASNILLDKDMNPKISDFGMARIFGGKDSQATKHIVGTYGYMSPEYALEGLFSTKSDVFSFGVLLLEILSGKRNTGFYRSDSLDLLGYAWDLWKRNAALEIVDPVLGDKIDETTAFRYINIALLCVQENAADRPSVSEVVLMSNNYQMILPSPKKPAFSNVRGILDPRTTKSRSKPSSSNDLTISIMEAR